MEGRSKYSRRKRNFWTFLIVGFIAIGSLFSIAKLPVYMAGWFVPFEVEQPYVPFEVDHKYSKVIDFDTVKMVYENSEVSITVFATSDKDWIHVSKDDERVRFPLGSSRGYYSKRDEVKTITFKIGEIHYAIDSKGISKEELIKIADSIAITQFS